MSNFLHIFGGSKIRFVFVTSVIVGHNVYYLGLTSQQRRKLRLKKEGIDRFILLAVMGWQIRKDFSSLKSFNEESLEYEEALQIRHEKTADRILKAAIETGGIYIKLGQTIAACNQAFPPIYVQKLSQLNDMALKSKEEETDEIIQEDLGKSLNQIFQTFNRQPIASASIAEVFDAVLINGERVAVKIQFIDLRDRFSGDIWTIKLLMDIAEWVFPGFNFKWAVNELCDTLEQELNFINEGQNSEKCAEDLKDFKYVYVPKVFWEYTSKRILTAEFIDAFKIDDLDAMKKAGINLKTVCERMCRVFGFQIFQSGFVHADPHPGNLFVRKLPDNDVQLVLLDHGLYQYVEPAVQRNLGKFWKSMILDDQDDMLKYAGDLGVYGLRDTAIFAAVLLQRPWYANVPFSSYFKGITKLDLQHMNSFLENHFSSVMQVLRALPLSLLLVIRNLNTIRSIVQTHGECVNRFRIMTECTVAKDRRNFLEYIRLRYRLYLMSAKEKLRNAVLKVLMFLNRTGMSSLPMFSLLEEMDKQPPPFSPASANLN